MVRKRSSSSPSSAAKRRAIVDQRSQMAQAAMIIRKTPALRGYARTSSSYTGGYRYGKSGAELKFFDNTMNFNFSTNGAIPTGGQLCTIPQDATQSGRVGRKIIIKKIVCNLTALINITGIAAVAGADRVRLVIVLDKQCNGAAADYNSLGNGVFNVNGVDALRNLDNVARFTILKDWDFALNCTAGVSGAWNYACKTLNTYISCNIPIEYDNSVTTGAIGSIRSNNIFLLACCGARDSGVTLQGQIRLRYLDA